MQCVKHDLLNSGSRVLLPLPPSSPVLHVVWEGVLRFRVRLLCLWLWSLAGCYRLSSRRRWKKKAILIHTGQGCARQCNDQYRAGSMDSRALQTKVLSAQFLPKPSPSFLGEVIWCPFLCCWKSILNKWAKNLNRTHYSCREHGTVGVGGSARFLIRQNTLKCNKNKE